MRAKRAAVMLALCALMASAALRPTPVYAASSAEIAGIATGAYLGVVLFGYAVAVHTTGFADLMPDVRRPDRVPRPNGLRVAPRCRQRSQAVTLLCW
jgi:hypothetical protein